jgi:CBS domain-containing protein
MAEQHLKRLAVVDASGYLLGIVSRVDLLRTVAQGYPAPEQPSEPHRPVRLGADVMRRDVPAVSLDAPLSEVLDAIVSTRLNRAVVLDEQGHVAGVVTDAKVVRRLGERPGIITSLMRRAATVPTTDHVKAADLMIAEVITTQPEVAIEVATREMLTQRRKILPARAPRTEVTRRSAYTPQLPLPVSSSKYARSPRLDPTVPSLPAPAGKGMARALRWLPTPNSSIVTS